MSLKLNIYPEIEQDIDSLIAEANCRSKTEYINKAILEFNLKIKRQKELKKLEKYFSSYTAEALSIAGEFAHARNKKSTH